jgi:GMP synthase (glutamine-hydrolysing)
VPDKVLILQHEDFCPPAWLGEVIDEAGLAAELVALHRGAPMPSHEGWLALASLGGRMGAYELDDNPWIEPELKLLAEATAAGVPVLGICLGGQLLAQALGGRAYRGPVRELGYRPLRLTGAGRADPVLGVLDGPVLSWHQDTFDLPPGAELLAASDLYPHAFRVGGSVGLQFHPETSPALLEQWIADAGPDEVRAWGGDAEALEAEAEARAPEIGRAGRGLLAAWVATLRSTGGRPATVQD